MYAKRWKPILQRKIPHTIILFYAGPHGFRRPPGLGGKPGAAGCIRIWAYSEGI